MKEGEIRTPGEVLGWASEYVAGSGTYVWNQKVYASVVGRQRVLPAPPHSDDQKLRIEVRREKERGAVPEPGAIVTAKITKIQPRMASADIVCVGLRAIKEKFTGIVRQQDVRATEIDKVEIHTSFRPGDIIRAEVLSLGDARAYYLSTAKNELGVVSATSDAGVEMVPVSWQEMQCPITGGEVKNASTVQDIGLVPLLSLLLSGIHIIGEGFPSQFTGPRNLLLLLISNELHFPL